MSIYRGEATGRRLKINRNTQIQSKGQCKVHNIKVSLSSLLLPLTIYVSLCTKKKRCMRGQIGNIKF